MDFNKYSTAHLVYPNKNEINNLQTEESNLIKQLADIPIAEKLEIVKQQLIDAKDNYRAALAIYNEEVNKIREPFKQDLFEELGIVGNPKAEKLYEIARQMGSCDNDTYCHASDMVELIL